MFNINKKNKQIEDLLKHNYLTTKVEIYFSTRTTDEGFDSYEKNYIYSNLNPITIKCYTRDIKAETLVWAKYGLAEVGAKEIICTEKEAKWFRLANKVKINSDTYQVYKDNVGNKVYIEERPFKLARVILSKVK